jgi:hypothetical protein
MTIVAVIAAAFEKSANMRPSLLFDDLEVKRLGQIRNKPIGQINTEKLIAVRLIPVFSATPSKETPPVCGGPSSVLIS